MSQRDSEELCREQLARHRRGFRYAKLCESIYGWTVRSGSGIDNWAIMARAQRLGGSRDAAVAWGRAWVAEDPERREFDEPMARPTPSRAYNCKRPARSPLLVAYH